MSRLAIGDHLRIWVPSSDAERQTSPGPWRMSRFASCAKLAGTLADQRGGSI
jgi:hypothetical protein